MSKKLAKRFTIDQVVHLRRLERSLFGGKKDGVRNELQALICYLDMREKKGPEVDLIGGFPLTIDYYAHPPERWIEAMAAEVQCKLLPDSSEGEWWKTLRPSGKGRVQESLAFLEFSNFLDYHPSYNPSVTYNQGICRVIERLGLKPARVEHLLVAAREPWCADLVKGKDQYHLLALGSPLLEKRDNSLSVVHLWHRPFEHDGSFVMNDVQDDWEAGGYLIGIVSSSPIFKMSLLPHLGLYEQ